MPALSSGSEVSSGSAYWMDAPYSGWVHGWGEWIGRLGMVCVKHWSAFSTYPGIERVTCPASYSHSMVIPQKRSAFISRVRS